MLDELKTVLQYSFLTAQIYFKGQFSKTFNKQLQNTKPVCVCVYVNNNKFSFLLVINSHYTKCD
jgi:hypothetical protein